MDPNPGGWQGYKLFRIQRIYRDLQQHQISAWEKVVLEGYPEATKVFPQRMNNVGGDKTSKLGKKGPVYYSNGGRGYAPSLVIEVPVMGRDLPVFRQHSECPDDDSAAISLD